jgi:rRNA processing protein Krr1/Pno1
MLDHSKRQLNALKDRIVEGDGETKQTLEELVRKLFLSIAHRHHHFNIIHI